ncbi:MAG: 16S rRNA (guanine(527)-N(7))-methyltransferase RsmG, partial [Pseudomonadota bacterium]
VFPELLLIDYLLLMDRWNHAYNLTAVREPLVMVERHVLDSLSIATWLEAEAVLDIGTGAGLPGIPLAIARPAKTFVLADSNGKKIRFVREVVRQLALERVRPIQSRMEALPIVPDVDIVCRALAPLAQLVEWTAEWLENGARLLAMKAELSDFERKAVTTDYNMRIVRTVLHQNSELNRQRCLAIITRP